MYLAMCHSNQYFCNNNNNNNNNKLLARFADALVAGVGEVVTGDGVRAARCSTTGGCW